MDNFITLLMKDYKIYLAVLFFGLISEISYLFGYTTSFGITSIFSFLTLNNVIAFGAYPIAILAMFLLFLFVVIISLSPLIKRISARISSKGRMFDLCIALISGVAVIFLLGFWLSYEIMIFGIPSFVLFIYTCSKYNSEIEKYLNIGLILLISPFIGYYFGYKDASLILRGEKYLYTSIQIDSVDKKCKLIGFINNHYFFIDMKNESILVLSDIPKIQFQKFVRNNKPI